MRGPDPRTGWVAVAVLVSLLLVALGCTRAGATQGPTPASPTPIVATPVCREDGVVGDGSVESPTQGWPIRFQYYLPPCYEEQSGRAYPVVYLIHGRGGSQVTWNSSARAAEIANRMIRDGTVPPFILITPANTSGDPYGLALANDLVPYVDEAFRTQTDRRHRVVGGASLGGVVAARMAFQFPDRFGSVGIFGGGMVSGDEGNFEEWIAGMPPQLWPRVLIDIGDQDTMMEATERLAGLLDERGIPYTLNVEPGGHTYAYWSSNLEMVLRWYAQDW